jgi:hypothetical protein
MTVTDEKHKGIKSSHFGEVRGIGSLAPGVYLGTRQLGTKYSWDSRPANLDISSVMVAYGICEVGLPKVAHGKLHNIDQISGSEYFSMIVLPARHLVPRLPTK